MQKHFFDLLRNKDLNMNEMDYYFELFTSNKRHLVTNAQYEAHHTDHRAFATTYGTTNLETASLLPLQLEFMWDLNRRLGIKHSCIPSQVVNKQAIQNVGQHLHDSGKKLKDLFGIRSRSDIDATDFRLVLKKLNQVYKNWTNVHFDKGVGDDYLVAVEMYRGDDGLVYAYSPVCLPREEDEFAQHYEVATAVVDEPGTTKELVVAEPVEELAKTVVVNDAVELVAM
jgi:hypothetical protein